MGCALFLLKVNDFPFNENEEIEVRHKNDGVHNLSYLIYVAVQVTHLLEIAHQCVLYC